MTVNLHTKLLSTEELEALTPSSYAFILAIPPIQTTTKGGIILTHVAESQIACATQKGVIWKIGECAFAEYEDDKPQVGHIGIVPKYSFGDGNTFEDASGTKYIILSDKNLAAFISKQASIDDSEVKFV